ncbi:MAG TPA: threonine-phosphate decarboxylase CobD [Azospirillaceae bacterium]|nr:threonine-phosphate decarboxylase CobD [Azospirillaceae bacterium]
MTKRFEIVSPVTDHGGALARAEARFGSPAEGWVDLSTGINPWPYPLPPVPVEAWARLPDTADLERLRAAAAEYLRVPEPSRLVAAPGSQALIQTLPGLLPPARVAIVGFTYAEHARCWRLYGHAVRTVDDLETAAQGADVVVVVNPNNPDGRRTEPPRLLDLAAELASRGGHMVVDEAFADVVTEVGVAAHAGQPGLVVLRSFGKFFGLAGVRLGIALGPADLMRRLSDRLGPWAVSGPALTIAAAAYADQGWIIKTRRHLAEAAQALDTMLEGEGMRVVGGTSLFRLVEHAGSEAVFESCARRGVLLRAFAARPGWLRVGLPADERSMARLRNALRTRG